MHELYYHRCVKLKDKILSFGGEDGLGISNKILEYSNITNNWKELKQKMPCPMERFGCTSILNGQFVVLFCKKNVSIYSVKNQVLLQVAMQE